MLNAKFRKLIKDPHLFFSDMVKNKKEGLIVYKLRKKKEIINIL